MIAVNRILVSMEESAPRLLLNMVLSVNVLLVILANIARNELNDVTLMLAHMAGSASITKGMESVANVPWGD